jgi:hypothetical protein
MKESCSNCEFSVKTEDSCDNEVTDDWVSCELVYVETRELFNLNGFKCVFYKRKGSDDEDGIIKSS